MSHPADIGNNVRQRRRHLGLTLEQLADASGVSPTMLSEIERSLKNPTVRLAYQVARALDCTLTDLLDEGRAPPPRILRATARRSLVDPETGIERHALSPEMLGRGLELVTYQLPAGQTAGQMAANRPGIVEHVTVTAGTLTLLLGDEPHILARGDGVTYEPQTTIEYRNDGDLTCEFVLLSDFSRSL